MENVLQRPEIHAQWEAAYHTPENERFFEAAFDFITREVAAPGGAEWLDAGCGSARHSMKLARRGYRVRAIDFSEHILQAAQENVKSNELSDRIVLQRDSLLDLSFATGSFDYALCWGVLMHVPEVDRAIAELARVLKPGGRLVVHEANQASLQAWAQRALRRLRSRSPAPYTLTAAGIEYWRDTPSGSLLARQADIGWLKQRLTERGFTLEQHVAGQFTELYTRARSKPLRTMIHRFNQFWFRAVKSPGLAFTNLLIFKKRHL